MSVFDGFICRDCGDNTHEIDEYYMVNDEVWEASGMGPHDGMLCIGCLEKRIGRRLNRTDFTDAPVNSIFVYSPRLTERLHAAEA